MEIIESDWGIANTFENRIELNRKLKEFPELRGKILKHELEHSKTQSFMANRKVDAFTKLKFRDIFPFVKKYPRAFFQQYIPISYSIVEDTIYFEWSLIFLYGLILGFIYLIYKLILFFSSTPEISFIILRNIFIVGGIVVGLFILGKFLKKYTSETDWNQNSEKLTKQQKGLKKLGIKIK